MKAILLFHGDRLYRDAPIAGLFDARLANEYEATQGRPMPWPLQSLAANVAFDLAKIVQRHGAKREGYGETTRG